MRIDKWTMKAQEELKKVVVRRMGGMDLSK